MVIFHSYFDITRGYFFNISSFQKETVVADSRSLPVNSKNRPPGPFFCSSGVGIVGGLELPNVPWRNGVMKHIPSAVGIWIWWLRGQSCQKFLEMVNDLTY